MAFWVSNIKNDMGKVEKKGGNRANVISLCHFLSQITKYPISKLYRSCSLVFQFLKKKKKRYIP